MSGKKISKREFIKQSALGMGALGCGFCNLDLMAKGSELFTQIPPNPQLSSKWTIEAKYYISTPKGLKCQLCPNDCKLKPGEESECRTRMNIEDKLYCYAYGNPCAINVDPIEKKPLYHFYPTSKAYSIATAGCNLACLNCQNWEISQTSPKKTRNYDLPPEKVVEEAIQNKCKSIAYTYSDPVAFWEYTYDTAKLARQEGIKNVLVSAGYIYEKPLREWCKYIDAANIDLKSFSDEIYEMLNAGTLEPVLNTLKILKEENVWLEITNLIVPDWTDDMDMIKQMCDWLAENNMNNVPLHFSRFHPQYKLANLPATPSSVLNKARDIAVAAGINHVYIGNVPGTNATNTYCPECKELLIERKGYYIITNKIKNGNCEFCQEAISGLWN